MGQDLSNTHFKLKKEITLGDMLTPVSVLVSAFGLWLTWHHDAGIKKQQYANEIRHSASVVTAKIERWTSLADRYFEDIQPPIIDVSETVVATHTREPANRQLFKGLMQAQATSSQRILEEQLEVAYIELYGYVPSLRQPFDGTILKIKEAEENAHKQTIDGLQDELAKVLQCKDTIRIGNRLRIRANEEREKLREQIERISAPLREEMLKLINLPDDDILKDEKREVVIKGTPNISAEPHKKT